MGDAGDPHAWQKRAAPSISTRQRGQFTGPVSGSGAWEARRAGGGGPRSLPLRQPLPGVVRLVRARGVGEELLEDLVRVVALLLAEERVRLAEEARAVAGLLLPPVEVRAD